MQYFCSNKPKTAKYDMKKIAFLLLTMLLPRVAGAEAVEINGIYYKLISNIKEAVVTSKPSGKYFGEIVIPESVLFDNLTYSVTGIENTAFSGCAALTSVAIPSSVRNIEGKSFQGCWRLVSISIPNSITSIGDSAFFNCSSLTTASIPNSVSSIGEGTFQNCSNLKAVAVPNLITRIENRTFYGCTGLEDVSISNSVKSIGESAFQGCSSLTEISIPESVEKIESYAFSGCITLNSVNLGEGLAYIGSNAFRCRNLRSITIPQNVEHIEDYAFGSSLNSVTINSSKIVSTEREDYKSLKTLFGDNVYTYTIGMGITQIGDRAFSGCTRTKEIKLPESIKVIGNRSFSGCTNLLGITIPKNTEIIGNNAFYNCTSLKEIEIPGNVMTIGNSAFNDCKGISTLILSEGIDSIGNSAFAVCDSITSVIIPNSVRYIGQGAFQYCNSLVSATIGANAEGTGVEAFKHCLKLKNVNIRPGVGKIDDETFIECAELDSIYIPSSIISIGRSAFSYCKKLASAEFHEGLETIGPSSFWECLSLTNLRLPNSVSDIGMGAFEMCIGLKTLVLGNAVKTISKQAFCFCQNLQNLYCYSTVLPQLEPLAFDDSRFNDSKTYNAILHVPEASLNLYKEADEWKKFKEIVAIASGEVPETKKCSTPTIAYEHGKLKFGCETEGVKFLYEVKDADIGSGIGNEVNLAPAYLISVVARKAGYDDSDVATATITWRNGKPVMEGFSSITLEDGDPKGDVNEDGTVDVADIATIISIMAGGDNNGDTSHAPVGVEAIDLGLPSGTLWANMNVGAERPEEGGLFFAWGEIMGYSSDFSEGRTFNWANYKWMSKGQSNGNYINKYQIDDNWEGGCWYDSNGLFVGDGKANLDLADDAAHVNWGGKWVMPTYEELCELLDNTTNEWTTLNGVSGRKFTSKTNGNSIFMPAAGLLKDKIHYKVYGHYWTASVYSSSSIFGWELMFTGDILSKKMYTNRFEGQNVRPVIRK